MSTPNDSSDGEGGRPVQERRRPTVAIVGASRDRSKYGNKSVRAHLQAGFQVYPVNSRGGEIEGLPVFARLADLPEKQLDRISIYVPPDVGLRLLPEIAAQDISVGELWFNPGSESDELLDEARRLGLDPIVACSIVDLGLSPLQF
jgi:hypothetical protein